VAATLPPNPFPFGHTIVLMTSAKTHEATAFVSLFQSLHFGIHMGTLSRLTDKSVVVFIDPQADRAPADIEEHKKDIQRDAAMPSALTPAAEDCAIRCMLALVKDLGNRLVRHDITMDDLWDVFSSVHGARIVGEIMFAPIAEALRRALDALPDQ
jgi:hypothetical protein